MGGLGKETRFEQKVERLAGVRSGTVRFLVMPYYVYVIELDKAFAQTQRAIQANPDAQHDKPCIYVGYTSRTPEERFRQHIDGARNTRGPLFSRIVYKYGVRLRPRLYQRYNPIDTKEEAEQKEKDLTVRYRKRGYTVWSN